VPVLLVEFFEVDIARNVVFVDDKRLTVTKRRKQHCDVRLAVDCTKSNAEVVKPRDTGFAATVPRVLGFQPPSIL
jgi:hypothetical protein